MFVKICGIIHPDDARAVVAAGADAIGLNFVPTSRRRIDIETARTILAVVPRHDRRGLSQSHRRRDPRDHGCARAACRTAVDEHAADIVMFDAPTPGSGIPFDWDLVADFVADLVTTSKILLVGGLRADNVAEAVGRIRPWGVDVATGVETSRGRKDPDAIARFVTAARAGEQSLTRE